MSTAETTDSTPESLIDSLLDQAYQARTNNLHQSLSMAEEALEKAKEIDYQQGEAKAENYLSLFHIIQCNFEAALEHAYRALDYYEKINDKYGIALSKYNIGSIHYRRDSYHAGIVNLRHSLRIFRELNDFHNQARALKSMGTIYEYFQDYENARDVYQQCIEASKIVGDKNSESNAYNPLSGIYLKDGNIEEAFRLIEKSIELKTETGDRRGLGFAIYGRGKIYKKLGQFDKAEQDFELSLQIHEEAGDQLGRTMTLNKLGRLYFAIGDYEKAKESFHQALKIANEKKINLIGFKVYYYLYQLAKEEGETDLALGYLESYISLKEAVINSTTHQIIKSYEEKAKIEALEYEAKVQRQKNEIIELKNAELDSFFYRVSHDLKGPISSLFGLHHLVSKEIKDPLAIQYFSMYQSQLTRINNIVMSLINLTQMSHGAYEAVKINFDQLIDECIHSYAYLEIFPKIKFIKEISAGIEFFSEWSIINTILQNLIENAIKYSRVEVESFVRISISQKADQLLIQVEDNGQGIHPDHQSKIFDMFYRANQKAHGSGLGLYILKRAVERLNGQISFESKYQEGTLFTISLPLSSTNNRE